MLGSLVMLLFSPALLLTAVILALARGEVWQYLSLTALFSAWMADALRLEIPAAVRCVRRPRLSCQIAQAASDAVFCAALMRAMDAMPQRHMRTPGVLYGMELVPWLAPIFLLCAILVWLLLAFRRVESWRERLAPLGVLVIRFVLASLAFCAAFVGNEVRPLTALGGILLAVCAGIETAHGAANDREDGPYGALFWATHMTGMVLLVIGIARLY